MPVLPAETSVHVLPHTPVLPVDILCDSLSLCWTHSYEVTLVMDIWQVMYTYGILSGIPYITSQKLWNVSPCSGLVKKSSNISFVGQYLSDKSPLSMKYLINKYCTRIWFVRFMIDYFPLFSMSIALILSWTNYSSSTIYTCHSIKYLDHRDCGKV